jgi:5S rRNA maturation endonuclease (ribonuclease M5)
VLDAEAIIVVEGRADVLNLLRYGIKNAVAVEGTKVPKSIVDLCATKTVTVFLDGDRGGELILRALLQVAEIDYVAFCPRGKSVEEISRKEITKALRNKVPVEYVREQVAERSGDRIVLRSAGDDMRPFTTEKAAVPGSEPAVHDVGEGSQRTLKGHMNAVASRQIARLLSQDFDVIAEARATEVDKLLEAADGDVAGVVIDRIVDQRLLDLLVGKGIEFIAAPKFEGIIKRPLSIRLVKID